MGVNDDWTSVEYTYPESRSSGTRSLSRETARDLSDQQITRNNAT
jgi:hypothetical protein